MSTPNRPLELPPSPTPRPIPSTAEPAAEAWTATVQDTPPDYGGGEGGGKSPGLFDSPMVPIVLIGAIMWFVVIGPERKLRKQREGMLSALKKNDRVMTNSGLFGTVTDVRETVVVVQIADGVRVKMARSAIQTLIEKDAEEGAE